MGECLGGYGVMGVYGGPNVVEDGLVLALDGGNSKSYPGSGTTWSDLSGNGNNGTLVNGVGYSGSNLGSLVFDGVDDYVNLGATNLSSTLSNLTISLFAKILKVNSKQALITSYTSSPQGGWGIELLDNNIVNIFGFTNTSTADGIASNQIVSLNQILNICFVFSNNTFFLYINGNIENSKVSSFSTIYKTSNVFLGRSISGSPLNYFQGNIAQVSIYNRALTASEIQQNFIATRSRFGI
jgi:hypothetical protein